jgi:hypothetical protein
MANSSPFEFLEESRNGDGMNWKPSFLLETRDDGRVFSSKRALTMPGLGGWLVLDIEGGSSNEGVGVYVL